MKLSLLITAFFGAVAGISAADSSSTVLRGSSDNIKKYATTNMDEYAPPAADGKTDLKALWDELAFHAKFMQNQIALGRSRAQCKDDCEATNENNGGNFNRSRCVRDCDEMSNNGTNNDRSNTGCGECAVSFNMGSNKYERCMEACREGGSGWIYPDNDECLRADNCDDCFDDCDSGDDRVDCLDFYDCGGGGSDRNGRDSCDRNRDCDGNDRCVDGWCEYNNKMKILQE